MTETRSNIGRRSVLRGGVLAGLAAPALVGPAIAQGEVTWRLQSHFPQASGSFSDTLQPLRDTLAERTDGRFRLDLFGDGEFARGAEIYNVLRRGVVQIATCSPSYIEDEAEAAAFAYGMPGTLREVWEMMHLLKNLGIEDLVNEDLHRHGVHYMAEKAYSTELVIRRPVNTMEDFQSLKLRSGGAMLDYLAAAGAAPQFLAGSEIYQALSSGVIDGTHWGAAIGALSMSLWEVAPYHVLPPLSIAGDGYLVNVNALEALPDDLRAHLLAALEERFHRRSVEYLHKEKIAMATGLRDHGVTIIDFPEPVTERLAQASMEVLERNAQRGPKAEQAADILQNLMRDLGYL